MLFVCEVEKQGNVIHVGVSMARKFLLLEGQAQWRSSGIDAARIWYLVILDLALSRVNLIEMICENYCWGMFRRVV